MSMKRLILTELNMIEGVFPFRYLGVPLHSKKLSFIDCRSLVEKITSKLCHWSTKYLSYGGRLELIRSGAAVIRNLWAHMFILPKKVIKKWKAYVGLSFGQGKKGVLGRLW